MIYLKCIINMFRLYLLCSPRTCRTVIAIINFDSYIRSMEVVNLFITFMVFVISPPPHNHTRENFCLKNGSIYYLRIV